MTRKTLCLCTGRHAMPESVEGSVFGNTLDPTDLVGMEATAEDALKGVDELTLYVTGLTVALVTVINVCAKNGIALTLMHFNVSDGSYYPQKVATTTPSKSCVFCGYRMPLDAWFCPGCGAS